MQGSISKVEPRRRSPRMFSRPARYIKPAEPVYHVYFKVTTGSELMPGVIAAMQTFGARINFHPHLHFLVTEGGVDQAGLFHKVPRFNDSRLAEIFTRELLADLVRKQLLSPEWAERLLSWRHTGFNVHSRVRAKTNDHASYYTPLDMSIID